MCKTERVLEYSRQNHDAGLPAGFYGTDGDNGVFACFASAVLGAASGGVLLEHHGLRPAAIALLGFLG
ncbi:hypothetical protein JK621_15225 [Serratia plymuthica]|nr:hypothetical protein [Serratia plymuthica]QUY46787.1 hypothetical protein JK621_15225 [Serratia plymuthica]